MTDDLRLHDEPDLWFDRYRHRLPFDWNFRDAERWHEILLWCTNEFGRCHAFHSHDLSIGRVRDYAVFDNMSRSIGWCKVECGEDRWLLCFSRARDAVFCKLRWSDHVRRWEGHPLAAYPNILRYDILRYD